MTGGGSGGHVYPLIAVAEKLEKTEPNMKIFYIGPYSPVVQEFKKRGYGIYSIASAKMRRYFSVENLLDIPKFIFSIFEALLKVFLIMPDVVFSKGGPGSLPVVFAAKFYFIPVVIHESDTVPGFTSRFAAKTAKRIGVSFEETVESFPSGKVFNSGNPVREEIFKNTPEKVTAKTYWGFETEKPLIFIVGGSQGAEAFNEFVANNFNVLIDKVQILHQVGKGNTEKIKKEIKMITERFSEEEGRRYKLVESLDAQEMKNAFAAADVVVSRAGSGLIFELAALGKPSIMVPLENSANDHQRKNAYAYESGGATIVLEQPNFKVHLFLDILFDLLSNPEKMQAMSEAAKRFARPEAAKIITDEILYIMYGSDSVKFQVLTEEDLADKKEENDVQAQ